MNVHPLPFISHNVFQSIEQVSADPLEKIALFADLSRLNTLSVVKRAGSGHLGSSFSSIDIVTYLYYEEMNTRQLGFSHPDRDIYFSSKGHDAPALYAVLYSLGVLSKDQFINLRRLGGVPGHPEITTAGIEAHTGSLGMGISKAKGMALAKKLSRSQGRVFVMTGDGELQEGQIYEALGTAVTQKIHNITVIVDHNKIQSDYPVSKTCDLGSIETKFRSFGWHVVRASGHDFKALKKTFRALKQMKKKPKIFIADTIKGKGVSFMEHPKALKETGGLYQWHSGAPDDASFDRASDELLLRINTRRTRLKLPALEPETLSLHPPVSKSNLKLDHIGEAYGETLVRLGGELENLIVLDADLSIDCKLEAFRKKFPARFIENGIAEQDMVSMAGGLARHGFLPIVNSFACFLIARANEQIYNNTCEHSKVIYAAHYAGLLPAGAGMTHQSTKDIALVAGLPGLLIIEPVNALETRLALEYAVRTAKESCVLRLFLGPSPGSIALPPDYKLRCGRGTVMASGSDGVLFAHGPVMLCEALKAQGQLKEMGTLIKVVHMPWLNFVDPPWLKEILEDIPTVYVLEDHFEFGGLGDILLAAMAKHNFLEARRFEKIAVSGFPACGSPQEVLKHHGLDTDAIVRRIAPKVSVTR